MKITSSQEIRDKFLDFFRKNDHQLITGSSIIPQNDPTLLFINSGMAPLKKYFLGTQTPPYPRLSNIQPCIRTNDIEDVGDRHHLTFFEMLGSWSIGDYYKEKAIELAFDLLVNHFKFSPEKLYATVYQGNPGLNIPMDEESIRFWEKVGLAPDHIVPLGEDNFWGPAGDTGPCGPCTEVFFDTGDEFGEKYVPGGHFDDVNRYIEIWNAGVFMELNKSLDDSYAPLPMKSVDTGSGVERMYLALNKCESLYDIDTIKPVFDLTSQILNSPEASRRDLRIVTDHLRATTILLGEGVIPDKDGRGYVVRRLIRKSMAIALRAGKSPYDLKQIVEEVIRLMKDWYPVLAQNKSLIIKTLEQEITDFNPIISLGLDMLDDKISKTGDNFLTGEFIFELVTTHGVPFEIISDFARKNHLEIDEESYLTAYRNHQEISRRGLKGKSKNIENTDLSAILEKNLAEVPETEFVGYKQLEASAKVIQIIDKGSFIDKAGEGQECQVVFDQTPFYAEAGGQVGDSGTASNDQAELIITDTQRLKNIYLHSVSVKRGEIAVGDNLQLVVEAERRKDIAKNHSATHLLHSSLRKVLGSHVVQKGSLVNEIKLRFDFLHHQALTDSEIKEVELLVNNWVANNYTSKVEEMNYQSAINSGAMALFSENYGDKVRVLQFGDVSTELCGGTHVHSTGEVGIFLITQENSVAKGIRRIEAITGKNAYQYIKEQQSLIKTAVSVLSTSPENLIQSIEKLKTNKTIQKTTFNDLSEQNFIQERSLTAPGGESVFIGQLNREMSLLHRAAERKINEQNFDIVLILSELDQAIQVLIMMNEQKTQKYRADFLIKQWLEPFGGKGGGKESAAKGGLKDKTKTSELLMFAEKLFI
jgi:alanyl-tRNA synthetase